MNDASNTVGATKFRAHIAVLIQQFGIKVTFCARSNDILISVCKVSPNIKWTGKEVLHSWIAYSVTVTAENCGKAITKTRANHKTL